MVQTTTARGSLPLHARVPPPARIRRSAEVRAVLHGGQRTMGRLLVVHVRPESAGSESGPRAAFVTGRTVGPAVVRNRARRLMREAWRACADGVERGCDVVFVGRAGIAAAGLGAVTDDMTDILRRGGAWVKGQGSG